jgi:hypothetical protein
VITPADELRTAAETLRKLAATATPGPWEGVVDRHQRGEVNASVWADSIGYYVTEQISSGDRHEVDAAYIAVMHPGVGLLLAEWLMEEALELANDDFPGIHMRALKIARAINAGGQP